MAVKTFTCSTIGRRPRLAFDIRIGGYHIGQLRHGAIAAKRTANNLNAFKDCHLENGSSQDQNVALTSLFVSFSRDSGH